MSDATKTRRFWTVAFRWYRTGMGLDFEIVAYRGIALSDRSIGELVQRFVRLAQLYRHSIATGTGGPFQVCTASRSTRR